jgi:small ligand-binding sensory domain FIST
LQVKARAPAIRAEPAASRRRRSASTRSRDAESAARYLGAALLRNMTARGGRPPAGALLFACNGRGRSMFGRSDHDAEVIADALAGAPAAGFFAAGEIGPVGGGYFLHSFTATVAVFA